MTADSATWVLLRGLAREHRPLLLVLNKCDRYTVAQREELRASLLARLDRIIQPENLVEVSADPAPRIYIEVDAEGRETETDRASPPDVTALKERIWEILEAEGKTLAAAMTAVLEANRCLQCKKTACMSGCPVGIDITEEVNAIRSNPIRPTRKVVYEDT